MKCSLMSLIPGHIGQQELFYLLIHFLYSLLLNGVEIGEIRFWTQPNTKQPAADEIFLE